MKIKLIVVLALIALLLTIVFLREQFFKIKINREIEGVCLVYDGRLTKDNVQFLKETHKKISHYLSTMWFAKNIDSEILLFEIESAYKMIESHKMWSDAGGDPNGNIERDSMINANILKESLKFSGKRL